MEREQVRGMVRDLLLASRFEERAGQAYSEGEFGGFLHLYTGEEAVAVGVLHAAEPSDYVVSTYREHVHALVKGVPPGRVMAELYGRRDGCSGGMGGSMHLFDRERRFMGGYAIVGETFPIAIGIAYGIMLRKLPEAVICFFGEGAANQGAFHESLNMAAMWRLPVLFVCENNRYQIGTEIHRQAAITEIHKRACAYGMPGESADGMDVLAVHEAAQRMLRAIRSGQGPQLLELDTYRFRGHSMADAGAYRSRAEVESYKQAGPLQRVEQELVAPVDRLNGSPAALDQTTMQQLRDEVEQIVAEAVAFAEASPAPTLTEAWDVFHATRRNETLIRAEQRHG
ncbi:MAG: pyruvate dehydrogenase (acetyl-transferring) E1 component subunit alpha [Thiobacillus sp.]|nr:pyruvate dehydrogenase (acetyl-transferring) E1 component subunit alpha [Thiobacillus sp.]